MNLNELGSLEFAVSCDANCYSKLDYSLNVNDRMMYPGWLALVCFSVWYEMCMMSVYYTDLEVWSPLTLTQFCINSVSLINQNYSDENAKNSNFSVQPNNYGSWKFSATLDKMYTLWTSLAHHSVLQSSFDPVCSHRQKWLRSRTYPMPTWNYKVTTHSQQCIGS